MTQCARPLPKQCPALLTTFHMLAFAVITLASRTPPQTITFGANGTRRSFDKEDSSFLTTLMMSLLFHMVLSALPFTKSQYQKRFLILTPNFSELKFRFYKIPKCFDKEDSSFLTTLMMSFSIWYYLHCMPFSKSQYQKIFLILTSDFSELKFMFTI